MLQNEKQKTRLFMPHLIHCTESDSRENLSGEVEAIQAPLAAHPCCLICRDEQSPIGRGLSGACQSARAAYHTFGCTEDTGAVGRGSCVSSQWLTITRSPGGNTLNVSPSQHADEQAYSLEAHPEAHEELADILRCLALLQEETGKHNRESCRDEQPRRA